MYDGADLLGVGPFFIKWRFRPVDFATRASCPPARDSIALANGTLQIGLIARRGDMPSLFVISHRPAPLSCSRSGLADPRRLRPVLYRVAS